ncbi:head GIN domain-containing protein [Spirosoma soli]|uniref:Head GIN domain-containing protein n=1 Tax=Spirosoma soli TaxID=1770529 RepID=A0ABW5MEG4_9BACT
MKRFFSYLASFAFIVTLITACSRREDIGPYQQAEQTYSLSNFNRLDMGSAFTIDVRQGNNFSIVATGDSRNLDDLDIYVRNNTLVARYRTNRNRKYETSFAITMPTLRGVSFSGASRSTVADFTNIDELDVELSGASKGEFSVNAGRMNLELSGASLLDVDGAGTTIQAEISGASNLHAFNYPAERATIDASGASKADLTVANSLTVDASGSSLVRYRGNPSVQQRVSGASKVQPD